MFASFLQSLPRARVRHSLLVLGCAAAATGSASADAIHSGGFAQHMVGGVVRVTFTRSGTVSAPIVLSAPGSVTASVPGLFTFDLTGEAFSNNWCLTNLSDNFDDFIELIDIDLTTAEGLFDDNSIPDTPGSLTGVAGVSVVSGPIPIASFEAIPWDGPAGDAKNAGDIYEREFILFETTGNDLFIFEPLETLCWHDDLDRVLCPWDCANGDGEIGIEEYLEILGHWGSSPGNPCDFDGDNMIGIAEYLKVLGLWGSCPLAPPLDSTGPEATGRDLGVEEEGSVGAGASVEPDG